MMGMIGLVALAVTWSPLYTLVVMPYESSSHGPVAQKVYEWDTLPDGQPLSLEKCRALGVVKMRNVMRVDKPKRVFVACVPKDEKKL